MVCCVSMENKKHDVKLLRLYTLEDSKKDEKITLKISKN